MILENGYISFFSSNGEPTILHGVPQVGKGGEWSALYGCQWRVLQKNYQGRSASRQAETISSYEVLLRDEVAWTERVRLYNAESVLMGEYAVISSEHLHILGIRRLIV